VIRRTVTRRFALSGPWVLWRRLSLSDFGFFLSLRAAPRAIRTRRHCRFLFSEIRCTGRPLAVAANAPAAAGYGVESAARRRGSACRSYLPFTFSLRFPARARRAARGELTERRPLALAHPPVAAMS